MKEKVSASCASIISYINQLNALNAENLLNLLNLYKLVIFRAWDMGFLREKKKKEKNTGKYNRVLAAYSA